jgi:hypothetical protein
VSSRGVCETTPKSPSYRAAAIRQTGFSPAGRETFERLEAKPWLERTIQFAPAAPASHAV